LDSEGIEVKRIEDRFLFEGESMERNLFFDIPEDLIGIFSVYAALSSDSNNFARQSVILGDSGATGFAIFDEPRNKLIAYLAFVIIIVLAVLLIVFGWRRKEKKYHESHSLYSNHHIHHPSLHHIKKLPNYGHH
jgi:hypothetical protein